MSQLRGPFGRLRFGAAGSPPAEGFTPESGFALSGTIADGQTLTLSKSGGGFGTKPNGAKPLYWYPFEADLNLSSLSRAASGPTFYGDLSTASLASRSSGSLLTDIGAGAAGLATAHKIVADPGFPLTSGFSSLYVVLKRNWDFDIAARGASNTCSWTTPPDFNLKHFRLTAEPGTESSQGHAWVEVADQGVVVSDGVHTLVNASDFEWDGSQWMVHEHVVSLGSEDTQDGIMQWWVDGRAADDLAHRVYWRRSGLAGVTNAFLDQLSNYEGPGANVFLDYFYLDDSWCRLLISDETTYAATAVGYAATRSLREIQIPTAWADGSISFVCRQGSHASLVGKYLYVVTSDGTALKAGSFS